MREALARSDEALAAGGYAGGRSPSRRVLAAIRLAERRADETWRVDEASLQALLRALLGETAG